jgi:Transposase, Mutator family
LLATQAGDVQLRIPKLRKGSFFPVILRPRRRIDQALYAAVMEAYVNGVSTRQWMTWWPRLAWTRGPAEFDRRGVIRHGVILLYRADVSPRRPLAGRLTTRSG